MGLAFTVLVLLAAMIYLNRNKINRTVEQAINEHIQGAFTFDGVSFMPFYKGIGVTFVFREVEVLDSVLLQPVVQVKRLGVRVSPSALWNEKRLKVTAVMFEDGMLSMVKNRQGYGNLRTFRKNNRKDGNRENHEVIFPGIRSKVMFEDMQVTFYDSVKNKSYGGVLKKADADIQYSNNVLKCQLNGHVFYEGLVFNQEKGAFLHHKDTQTTLDFFYQFAEKKIVLQNGTIVLGERYPVALEGEIQLADTLAGVAGSYRFEFTADNIPAGIGLSHLTKALEEKISGFNILPELDSRVLIEGKFNEANPLVEVHFVTDTFQYAIRNVALNRLRATGFYSSQYDKKSAPSDSNSAIICSRIDGSFEEFPVRGDLKIINLKQPEAWVNYDLKASMYEINKMLDPRVYRIKEGDVRLIGNYRGNLKPLFDVKEDAFTGKIAGQLTVRNISGDFIPRKVEIRHLNADVRFDEKMLSIHRMSFQEAEVHNLLKVTGQAEGLMASLMGSEKPIQAQVDIQIDDWKLKWLEELTAQTSGEHKAVQGPNPYKLSEWIDRSIGKLELKTQLNAGKVTYKKFVAEELKGQMLIAHDKIDLEYLSLKAFDGTLSVSGQLSGLDMDQSARFDIKGNVKDADVKKVFYSLGNFGQETLTDKNIEGLLQADFRLASELNPDASIVFPSVEGFLWFDLSNGKIKNFEPFLKIKRLAFKNRDLEDVQFEPIRSRVEFKGKEILVDQLGITSNVLDFSIDGIYSFGDKTNLSIRIPVSNFRNDRSLANQRRKGSEKAIFLKAIEQNGNVNIMLDGKKSLQ